MTWFGKTLRSVVVLGFALSFLALSEILMTFAPSKLMLELRAGLLLFVAPSNLAREAVAPSELLPDVV
jgi:hypothetical protein